MKKINVHVGDNINVDVCQPKFGKYPIGRFNGMVCKLILPETIKRLEYGCTIDATVMVIYEKYLTVLVNEVIVSAVANNAAYDVKINELKSMFTKPVKHEKVKRSYPYLSKVELNQL